MRGLTALKVEHARANPTKRREIPDKGKPGLFLVVQPSGFKSWCVRYRRLSDKKPCKYTIPGGFVSLATARKLAQQVLDQVAEGGDPAAQKQADRRAAHEEESDFAGTVALFL